MKILLLKSNVKRPREERKEHFWGDIFNLHRSLTTEFLGNATVEITLGPQSLRMLLRLCVDGDKGLADLSYVLFSPNCSVLQE